MRHLATLAFGIVLAQYGSPPPSLSSPPPSGVGSPPHGVGDPPSLYGEEECWYCGWFGHEQQESDEDEER